MIRKMFCFALTWGFFFLSGLMTFGQVSQRPNVLFISIDDMNDWTTLFDVRNPIRTPNLQRIAERGVFFSKAYCASPSCNASRTAVLTARRPHHTGVYDNRSDWKSALSDVRTLPRLFCDSGYFVAGAGKTFHHEADWAFHDQSAFHEYLLMSINEPYPAAKLNGFDWFGSRNTDWGVFPFDIRETADYRTAEYAIAQLQKKHDRPFFLSVGIYKPHSPFFAPAEYFDAYPPEGLRMPSINADDNKDLPSGAHALQDLRTANHGSGKGFWQGLLRAKTQGPTVHEDLVRAYQACSGFADAMIGRVFDALEKSPYRDNTVIVIWSDHGFHLGEKEQVEKFALWEKTTHVPYIIVAPGQVKAGQRIATPVDLMSVYPTVAALCGLPAPVHADGVSLLPLMRNAQTEMPPALMTYLRGNHAVRTDRWRYIRYADGSEELYDHANDPEEWVNLALDKDHRKVMDGLRRHIPTENAVQVRDLK